ELRMRLGLTAALMVFLLFYYTRSTLQSGAVFGACLVGYVCGALGGWQWLLPPLILFLGYTLLSPRTEANSRRVHNVHAVIAVSAAGLVWLFLFRILERSEREFLYLFTLAFAAELAIIGVARLGSDYPKMSGPALLAVCVLEGWVLLFVPYLVLEWHDPMSLCRTLLALPGVALAAVGVYLTQPGVRDCPMGAPRWRRQAATGAAGSALGLVPLYLL